ncbi:MAG: DUF6502 family protein [Rhodoferax sp.]
MNEPVSDVTAESARAGLPEPALAAQAVAQVLHPLARLMIDHGLQLSPMIELLKQALVAEAMARYGLADKGSSDTRIALLTGVHRKDVKRLREAPAAQTVAPPMMPVAAAVVARWISDPNYLNADQSARPLARTPRHGHEGHGDFTSLVASVSRDVGARAVLDELQRLGVVDIRDDGQVVLMQNAFVPKEGLHESFHFLAANVADHLATAVHNLTPARQGDPMLEQSAFSADLSVPQAQALHARARALWAASLQQFLQTATVAEQRSQADPGPRVRVRFGAYFHQAEQASADASAPAPARRRGRKSGTPSESQS